MKIELDGEMLFDDETGEDICKISELQGEMLNMVVKALLSERDSLEDEVGELSMDIEVLKDKIYELEEDY